MLYYENTNVKNRWPMQATPTDIDSLLRRPNTYFKIPEFQRPYSWHRNNYNTFLDDFKSTLSGERTHYLGNVFYQQNGRDESIIIDGQQRITTILLMLTAIYHLVQDRPELADESELALRIKDDFLENKYGPENNRVKLRGMTDDDQIFKRIFKRQVKDDDKTSGLYEAYEYLRDQLGLWFDQGLSPQDLVEGLANLKIIEIQLEPDRGDDLQKIFEGINSTGEPLGEGDKIRNFALMLNQEEIRNRVIENYWRVIEEELVKTKTRTDFIADFFRKFLISQLGQDIKEREVYAKFKDFFRTKVTDQSDVSQIDDFYQSLLAGLERYLILKHNSMPASGQYDAFRRQAFRINYLEIEVVYPFLMSVLADFQAGRLSEKAAKEMFTLTESYLTRRLIVGIRTTGLNNFYHGLWHNIAAYSRDNQQADYVEIYKYILLTRKSGLHFPSRRYIEERFADSGNTNNRYLYFILSSWDDYRQPKESFLLDRIKLGKSSYSLEHIMPQTLNKDWKRDLGDNWAETHERYLNCLANLTLTAYNSEYSNKRFEEKLRHQHGYLSSPLLINEFVKSQKVWNEQTIKNRIEWWLDKIDLIWPLPQSGFEPKTKGAKTLSLTNIPTAKLAFSKPINITILDGEPIAVSRWKDLLESFLETAHEMDGDLATKLVNDPKTSSWTTKHSEDFRSPFEIAETGIFIETSSSTGYRVEFIQQVAEIAGIDGQDIKIEVLFRKSDNTPPSD